MYSVCRQIHPPTTIEDCNYCNFFNRRESNLILTSVNQLQVFRINHDVQTKTGDRGASGDGKSARRSKLELVAQFSIFGNIMSIRPVAIPGSHRDSLLLSFHDAKLCMVEYDPTTHDLKTTSMHYFEDEDLKLGRLQMKKYIPTVRVDPDARCAAMLYYGTKLVILPFRRDLGPDELDATSSKPILSSYMIDLSTMDEKIVKVLDIQFLHGYYEPTILILHEPLPTWAGRVAVRKDSCSIMAVSLNLVEKVHPVIWSLAGLPFDCLQVLAVPKPIGGVLVMAVNSLIYLNQSVPPYGVALNAITRTNTEFLLKPQEGIKTSLDCAQACFISDDQLVISLKSGELYVLTIVVDGMRSVRSFHFDKAASSVLTSCMCTVGDGYLFLGARLANCLLLRFSMKQDELPTALNSTASNEPPSKKKKVNEADLDELEVYGTSTDAQQADQVLKPYTFEVCDSLVNIGPCGQVVMGEPSLLSEEFASEMEPILELVTTSGYGKNGALSVLQRSIRPQVVTTFQLPGIQDVWTVMSSPPVEQDSEDTSGGSIEGHSFLLLGKEDSIMVLQTGNEIMELDHSGFGTSEPTIYAGNIGGDKNLIIQVSPRAIRLLDHVKQIQHIPMESQSSDFIQCSVANPYVLLLTEEGQINMLVLKLDGVGNEPRLAMVRPVVTQGGKVTAVCMYDDRSGMFSSTVTQGEDDTQDTSLNISQPVPNISVMDIQDEDELLYGDADRPSADDGIGANAGKDSVQGATASSSKSKTESTYWAILARDLGGQLEVYSMPDFKLCYLVKNFTSAPKVLVDSVQATESDRVGQDSPVVKELLMVTAGQKKLRPHMFVRLDHELLIYEAFPFAGSSASTDCRLKMRFKKVPHGVILKDKKTVGSKKDVEEDTDQTQLLQYFSDVAGYSGVFVCGANPYWIFITARGCLRPHPMNIDGSVLSFKPFDNVNCPKGFIYFNSNDEMRICVLPSHLTYDAAWPVRKVPLKCTPHHVVYHMETKTYAVVTSVPELCSKVVRLHGDGEKEFEMQEREEGFIYPSMDRFIIQLFSPTQWEAIPNTKIEMEEFEHIMCAKCVVLRCEGTLSGYKGYVAIGTNYSYNEDVTSRGRILIFDVIEVVPEPGQPLTKNKFKLEYDKEQKGPVTALDHVEGYLVTAIGQKIYIWTLKDNDLNGVAFIDTQVYICAMASLKNLIMVGDIMKSFSVLRYQEHMKVLSLVSRDTKPLEVYSLAFLVDGSTLTFMASDREKNLLVYGYQPEMRESNSGQRLLRKADYNVGSHINSFFRVKSRTGNYHAKNPTAQALATSRHVTYYATLDGSIGFVLPLSEKTYRRLLMLQNALTNQCPHIGGLNPKHYRAVYQESRMLVNPQKNILDGDLLWKYLHMSQVERNEFARKIGTTADQLLDDLSEIEYRSMHF